jgi:hypothetical protein
MQCVHLVQKTSLGATATATNIHPSIHKCARSNELAGIEYFKDKEKIVYGGIFVPR